jgi:Fe-S-cluster containining protein
MKMEEGKTEKPAAKPLRKLDVLNGRINFSCLQQECPSSCCGPFGGVKLGIDSIEGREFSEILLTPADYSKIVQAGHSNLIERTAAGDYRMRLEEDGTCCALKEGLCSINDVKPTICRAFPFYVDMFVGLCGITDCPGFGAGWTKVENLQDEVNAAKEMYTFWLSRLSIPTDHEPQ